MPVSVSDNSLRIDGFETAERDIVSHFTELHDLDLDGELARLLRLGILAQGSVGTIMDTKYVETAFDGLKDKFNQRMDKIFEQGGELADILDKQFGQDGKVVKEIFNPDAEGTPLNRLKVALHMDLSEIKDKIVERRGYEDAAKKGTQKGVEFEDACEPYIRSTAEAYSDMVESTGSAAGDLGSSKKGDFVVMIDGTEKRIVFEMKHRVNMVLPTIRRELNVAMENRRAEYGVLVSRNRDALPMEVGWFNEYDGNKLVCAVSETDEDRENMWVIKIAYRWARLRATSNEDKSLDVDPEAITQHVKEIEASLRRMATVTTQCKAISASTEKIESVMREEERKIKDRIGDITHSMSRLGT